MMYMPYSQNPHLPSVRMLGVRKVKYGGWSVRKTARYFGVQPSTVSRWCKKDPTNGWRPIATESSRPKTHPHALSRSTVEAIVTQRNKRQRCGKVIHEELRQQGVAVSLSSVNRTLKRCWLLRERSPWKRWHFSTPRPYVQKPGDLVQIDTIHIVTGDGERIYIYTLIDIHSRWAYAKVVSHINTHASLAFVAESQQKAPFVFRVLQSDHGSEFSTWFSEHMGVQRIVHRHSRVRQSNDNAHVERFNRTLQEECLDNVRTVPSEFRRALKDYIPYYNNERLHLGINMRTPSQVLRRC